MSTEQMMKKIDLTQNYLKKDHIDGWLLYYFDKNNPLAIDFLEIDPKSHLSRRFFYWIPSKGEPVKIVHTIEPHTLDHLPGKKLAYHTKEQLDEALKKVITPYKKIAMEYSKEGALPYISKVDAGMIEKIRKMGLEVVSSAPFLQYFTCCLNQDQQKGQQKAGTFLDDIAKKAFKLMFEKLEKGEKVTELEVQEFILKHYEKEGFIADFAPTVAFGVHSSDPHYMPTRQTNKALSYDEIILIDCVAKTSEPSSVYADITRMGYSSRLIPQKIQNAFDLILRAQEETFEFISHLLENGQTVRGFEADQVCRKVIEKAGFAKFFTHRTGHNLYEKVHGPGAHLDSFETHDDRPLIPLTSFTIEPGLYFPNEFGVRVEYDVFIDEESRLHIISGKQTKMFKIH